MKQATQEEKLQFLNDTVEYYKTHPRGINKGYSGCCYSNGCAIGRHLSKNLCERLDKKGMTVVDYVFDLFPMKIQKYGKDFLTEVQELHDCETFWDKNLIGGYNLTLTGTNEFEIIKKKLNC